MSHTALPSYKTESWLQKFGWERGKGLGKNEDGISEYIKVTKKIDNSGIGSSGLDERDRLGFGWWDHLYNKSASAITVDQTAEEVKVAKVEQTSQEKLKAIYGGLFVKAKEEDDKDFSSGKKWEDLFSLCGGRTLGKYDYSGKTKRLEEFDKNWKKKTQEETKEDDSIKETNILPNGKTSKEQEEAKSNSKKEKETRRG